MLDIQKYKALNFEFFNNNVASVTRAPVTDKLTEDIWLRHLVSDSDSMTPVASCWAGHEYDTLSTFKLLPRVKQLFLIRILQSYKWFWTIVNCYALI